MQRCTIFFIIVNAVNVSGGFSAHHQELKNCTHTALLAATSKLGHIPDAVCTGFVFLMMGGKTARNMYSIDSNKECCITLHLAGYT